MKRYATTPAVNTRRIIGAKNFFMLKNVEKTAIEDRPGQTAPP
jgi:hypothetical protein